MANLVETLMDKMKVPEKLELSQADRQLLQKLAASVDELKAKKTITEQQLNEAEERLLAQMRILLEEAQQNAPTPEPAKPQEIDVKVDFSDLKHFISEEHEQGKYQIKSLIEEKNGAVVSQLHTIQTAVKDEEILNKMPTLFNQLNDTELALRKQLRTVKIMMGFTIWISIMTLAAMVAQVLGLI